ncbi:MAG TPA: O-antigen ligase family protein [Solirubrobacterales bacterium]|nr:O-antigen ligase family protein [Solirubrobacterales bacterium]
MEALARNRQSPSTGLAVALWGGGALLAVVFGVAAATSVAAVAGLIAVLAASAVVVVAFTATRWALLALLFLLYSYAGWVLGHTVGGPEVSQVLLLIIIAAVAWRHLERTERFSLPGELIAVLILGVAFAASAAFTTDAGAGLRQIWDFIGYALTVVAIVALLDRPEWLRRAVWTVVVAGGALAILSLLQAGTGAYDNDFAGFAIARPEGAGVFRVGGPLDPNFFGQVLVATAVLAVYLALSARDGLSRGFALAIFMACIAVTGLTGSRGALVATAAAFCLILLLAPIPRDIGAAIAALVVIAGLVFMPSGLQARIGLSSSSSPEVAKVTRGSEDAIQGRKSENLAALQMFRDHPLLGVGPGNYPQHYLSYSQRIGLDPRLAPREAHSLYLGALGETGIIGACALLAVLWLAVRGAWRGRRSLRGGDALLAEGIFVSLMSFLVAGLFLHAAYPRYLWILVGFGFAAGQLARKAALRASPAHVALDGPAVAGPTSLARPPRARPKPRWRARPPRFAMATAIGVALAACIVIGLLVAGQGDRETPAQIVSRAEPAGSLAGETADCDPIIGSGMANSGRKYALTSFAPGGNPADCARAESIVLSALNGGSANIGKWSCTTNPAGPTIATCISADGAKISAHD